MLRKHRIQKITAVEYNFSPEGNYPKDKGAVQSVKTYNKQGYLIEEKYTWGYFDRPDLTRKYVYNDSLQLVGKQEFHGEELFMSEIFEYDSLGRQTTWVVDFSEGKTYDFKKTFRYDPHGQLSLILLNANKKLYTNKMVNSYDDMGRVLLSKRYNDTLSFPDSTVYKYGTLDTLWHKEFYRENILQHTTTLVHRSNKYLLRGVEYVKGQLNSITYHNYSSDFELYEQRNFHILGTLNYEKKYEYTDIGEPLLKKVFKSGDDPETLVRYRLEYFH